MAWVVAILEMLISDWCCWNLGGHGMMRKPIKLSQVFINPASALDRNTQSISCLWPKMNENKVPNLQSPKSNEQQGSLKTRSKNWQNTLPETNQKAMKPGEFQGGYRVLVLDPNRWEVKPSMQPCLMQLPVSNLFSRHQGHWVLWRKIYESNDENLCELKKSHFFSIMVDICSYFFHVSYMLYYMLSQCIVLVRCKCCNKDT